MKFSIIVPVYNGAKYLKNAMDSVLGQIRDGGCDLEVILVENGSTDDSARICDEYASGFHMITALHRGKIGAYAARRLGMETASGRWLLFLDADDELKEGALDALGGFIDSFGEMEAPDMIFYDYERMTLAGDVRRSFPFESGKVYKGPEKKKFYDEMCRGDLLNPLWNKCVKKELADASLVEDTTIFLNHGEDLLQTAQLLDRAGSISYLSRVVYRYKCDNQGLSGKYHNEFLPNQKHAWEKLDEFAKKWGSDPSEYEGMINERKTLTTTIAAKSVVMSDLSRSEVLGILTALFEDPFYREFSRGKLPDWASEEDVFFHEFQMTENPKKAFMKYFTVHRIKAFIKARIRK